MHQVHIVYRAVGNDRPLGNEISVNDWRARAAQLQTRRWHIIREAEQRRHAEPHGAGGTQ